MERWLCLEYPGEREGRGEVGAPFRKLVGGSLCLDFVNTVGAWVGDAVGGYRVVEERLSGYDDLLAWSRTVGALDDVDVERLRGAIASPAAATAVTERARMLRRILYGTFRAASEGRMPEGAQLDRLNAEVGHLRRNERLVAGAGGLTLQWVGSPRDVDAPLWPVARSAVRLLTTPALLDRVGRCAGERCGWLFLDTSRGRRRRWCDMADCGNVAKVRAHRARTRGRMESHDGARERHA